MNGAPHKRRLNAKDRKFVFASNLATQETASSSAPFGEHNESEESPEVDHVDMCVGDVDTDVVEMVVYDDFV